MSENTFELRVTKQERNLIIRLLWEFRITAIKQKHSVAECDALLEKVLPAENDEATIELLGPID